MDGICLHEWETGKNANKAVVEKHEFKRPFSSLEYIGGWY
jgi:hypothetical protein